MRALRVSATDLVGGRRGRGRGSAFSGRRVGVSDVCCLRSMLAVDVGDEAKDRIPGTDSIGGSVVAAKFAGG